MNKYVIIVPNFLKLIEQKTYTPISFLRIIHFLSGLYKVINTYLYTLLNGAISTLDVHTCKYWLIETRKKGPYTSSTSLKG